jgi:hypothetical protein
MCYQMARRIKDIGEHAVEIVTTRKRLPKIDPSAVAAAILEGYEAEPRTYSFTLTISKPAVRDTIAADRLYQNCCNDALFHASNNEYGIDFDREAFSLEAAITSAIGNINESDIGSHITGIELHARHKDL